MRWIVGRPSNLPSLFDRSTAKRCSSLTGPPETHRAQPRTDAIGGAAEVSRCIRPHCPLSTVDRPFPSRYRIVPVDPDRRFVAKQRSFRHCGYRVAVPDPYPRAVGIRADARDRSEASKPAPDPKHDCNGALCENHRQGGIGFESFEKIDFDLLAEHKPAPSAKFEMRYPRTANIRMGGRQNSCTPISNRVAAHFTHLALIQLGRFFNDRKNLESMKPWSDGFVSTVGSVTNICSGTCPTMLRRIGVKQ